MQALVFCGQRNNGRNKPNLLRVRRAQTPAMICLLKRSLSQGMTMTSLADAPAPEQTDSGVAGTQQAGSTSDIVAVAAPLEGQLLPRTVMGLVANSPDHYGGQHNAPIIGAIINDFAFDKDKAGALLAEKQAMLDKAIADLHEQTLKNARLEERLNESVRSNMIAKICTFFSPVLLSLAVDLFKTSATSSYLVGAIGLGLLLTNFIPSRGRN